MLTVATLGIFLSGAVLIIGAGENLPGDQDDNFKTSMIMFMISTIAPSVFLFMSLTLIALTSATPGVVSVSLTVFAVVVVYSLLAIRVYFKVELPNPHFREARKRRIEQRAWARSFARSMKVPRLTGRSTVQSKVATRYVVIGFSAYVFGITVCFGVARLCSEGLAPAFVAPVVVACAWGVAMAMLLMIAIHHVRMVRVRVNVVDNLLMAIVYGNNYVYFLLIVATVPMSDSRFTGWHTLIALVVSVLLQRGVMNFNRSIASREHSSNVALIAAPFGSIWRNVQFDDQQRLAQVPGA